MIIKIYNTYRYIYKMLNLGNGTERGILLLLLRFFKDLIITALKKKYVMLALCF